MNRSPVRLFTAIATEQRYATDLVMHFYHQSINNLTIVVNPIFMLITFKKFITVLFYAHKVLEPAVTSYTPLEHFSISLILFYFDIDFMHVVVARMHFKETNLFVSYDGGLAPTWHRFDDVFLLVLAYLMNDLFMSLLLGKISVVFDLDDVSASVCSCLLFGMLI